MLKHDAEAFYNATVALGMNRIKIGDQLAHKPSARDKLVDTQKTATIQESLEALSKQARVLGLEMVEKAADRLVGEIRCRAPHLTWDVLECSLRDD